jgi:hypothetical protein
VSLLKKITNPSYPFLHHSTLLLQLRSSCLERGCHSISLLPCPIQRRSLTPVTSASCPPSRVLVLVVLAPPVVRAAHPAEPRLVLVAPVRTHTESRGGIGNGARISRKPTDDYRGFFAVRILSRFGAGFHPPTFSLFVSLVYCAESTVRWFVVREKHCWMTADSADKSKRTGRLYIPFFGDLLF